MVRSYFVDVDSIVAAVKEAAPSSKHIEIVSGDEVERALYGKRMVWNAASSYVVKIAADKIRFMEGNLWNFTHAAAVMDIMQDQGAPELPVARVHQIKAADVKKTQKRDEGELAYQELMTRPWTKADVGDYYAVLLDGNHRAAAALALGEPFIYVIVGENYRENVKKGDWL